MAGLFLATLPERAYMPETTIMPTALISFVAFHLQISIFLVEPRGFEPLTSAVHRRVHTIVVVRLCSENPANRHIDS